MPFQANFQHPNVGRIEQADRSRLPKLSDRFMDGGVDRWAGGQENASDHPPTCITLDFWSVQIHKQHPDRNSRSLARDSTVMESAPSAGAAARAPSRWVDALFQVNHGLVADIKIGIFVDLGETFLRKLFVNRSLNIPIDQLIRHLAREVNPSIGFEVSKVGASVVVIVNILAVEADRHNQEYLEVCKAL